MYFNPIIVLFLTNLTIDEATELEIFQSYYSLISNIPAKSYYSFFSISILL